MTYDDIIRHWGTQNLQRWDRSRIADTALSDSSKDFLVDVGLPRGPRRVGLFVLRWHSHLPVPSKAPSRRILGFNHDSPILIDQGLGGAVVWGEFETVLNDEYESHPEQFVNTSVESFGVCLTAYDQLDTHGAPTTEQEDQEAIARFWDVAATADPEMAARPDGLWPYHVLEMCHFAGGPADLEERLLRIGSA